MSQEQQNPTLKTWEEIYKGLTAPFKAEAYSVDSSRGFDLTSIKAQYLVERLNEVVGVGNWRHEGSYELNIGESQNPSDATEVIFMGKLTIFTKEGGNIHYGIGSSKLGGKKSLGDAYKGAKTDSLSKCASLFGLGNDVFKGLVAPPKKGSAKSSGRALF